MAKNFYYKDFRFENVRRVFNGHLVGAIVGGIVAYWAFTIYNTNPTFSAFAITPLERSLKFVDVDATSTTIMLLIIATGAFIGAFLQARGRY